MISDYNKVIAIPKSIPFINNIDYICSCRICSERFHKKAQETSVVHEAMQQVEAALQNTSFSEKEVSLQLLNPSLKVQHVTFDQLSEYIIKTCASDVLFTQAIIAISKLCSQFNKKYRHPLICFLHDTNLKVIENLNRNTQPQEYHDTLLRYNAQLAYLRDQQDILREIYQEQFLQSKNIVTLFNKTDKAFFEIKTKAQILIQDFYSRTPHSDMPPNMIMVKAAQRLA